MVYPKVGFKFVLEKGYAFQLGDGTATQGAVHVEDLSKFLVLLTEKIVDDGGKDIPTGKRGILFAQVGTINAKDVVKATLKAAAREGLLTANHERFETETRTVEVGELGARYGGGEFGDLIASVVWAGHKNTRSSIAFKIGWKPAHSLESLEGDEHWDTELQLYLSDEV